MAKIHEDTNTTGAEQERPAAAAAGEYNWGQTVHFSKVEPPADFDTDRPPDDVARLGYLKDGRPWSPYGTFESGGVRKTPGKPKGGQAPPGAGDDGPRRRYAPGDQKPVEDVEGLYTALDDAHVREVELVKKIRTKHPETKLGDPIHPRDLADGAYVRSEPYLGSSMVADMLIFAASAWSNALDDPKAMPSTQTLDDASIRVERWSAHWGMGQSQSSADAGMAIVALLFVFGPLIIASVKKLVTWFDERAEKQKRQQLGGLGETP